MKYSIVLRTGVALAAIWAGMPGQLALAQGAGDDDTVVLDKVMVVGEKARNAAAIEVKKNTLAIYDSVSIDDIGKLPDLNVPDAFRRVPGVTAIFDEDEGRFVTARGLPTSYNYTTIDGFALATAGAFGDGSRDVNLETIPSSSVSRLEVFKTFTPDIDAGAMGGYFNLVTKSAYDFPDNTFIADGALTYYTFDDVPDDNSFTGDNLDNQLGGRAQFTATQLFGASDQFGLVLSGSYQRKTRDEEKVIPDSYNFLGDDNNNDGLGDIAVPSQYRWYVYTNRAERYGASAKLEWRPDTVTEIAFNNFLYISQENETRSGHQIRGISASDITMDTATSGSFADAQGEITVTSYPLDYRYTGHTLSGTRDMDNGAQLTGGVGFSTALMNDTFPEFFARTPANRPELGGTYDLSGDYPTITINDPAYWSDPRNYAVNLHRERTRDTSETLWDAKLDYAYNPDGSDLGWGYAVGSEYRSLLRKNDTNMTIYASGYVVGDIGVDNQTGYTARGRDVPFFFIDYDKVKDLGDFSVDEISTIENSINSDFKYGEDVFAAYAKAAYGGENWAIVGGLRYDDVSSSAKNYQRIGSSGLDTYELVNTSGGYDNILPSIMASFEPSEGLRFKAAASQTLARPAPGDIAQTAVLSADGTSLSRGNPNLQPRMANNFDLGAEYYFDEGNSLLSIGLFYKDISDEIVTRVSEIAMDGQTVRITQPVNAESAEVKGIELALIKNNFDNLPAAFPDVLRNFGVSANLTWTDAKIVLDSESQPVTEVDYLLDQPEWFGNASIFYEWDEGSEARLAYTYQSDYHDAVSASPASQAGWEGAKSLDFSLRKRLTDMFSLTFEARNITDENRIRLTGPGLGLLREDVEFGKSFFFGVSYKH